MGNGTVISLGQVIVDLTMSVEKIPQPGQDVFADEAGIHVGASYNTLHAVRQMGVDARHAGILGTGPWADTIRRVFESEGIRHVGPTDESVDSGFCVALTDGTAERTFISMRGAEARGDATGSGHMSFQNRSGEAACHANLIVIMTISWVMMCPNGSAKRTRNALPPAWALSRKVQGSEGDITENEQG